MLKKIGSAARYEIERMMEDESKSEALGEGQKGLERQ